MDFRALPVSVNLLLFAAAAALVWAAGTRLAKYADAIGDRTKLSKAFLGLVLLGIATSLPEIGMVTGIYLLGLLERRNRTVFRMGYDSLGVLVAYTAGIVGL